MLYFKTVSEVQNEGFNFEAFKEAWERNQRLLELPAIDEETIRVEGIPEGQVFRSFTGYLNGRLCSLRLVKARDQIDLTIDAHYDVFHMKEIQKAIEQRVGEALLLGKLNVKKEPIR